MPPGSRKRSTVYPQTVARLAKRVARAAPDSLSDGCAPRQRGAFGYRAHSGQQLDTRYRHQRIRDAVVSHAARALHGCTVRRKRAELPSYRSANRTTVMLAPARFRRGVWTLPRRRLRRLCHLSGAAVSVRCACERSAARCLHVARLEQWLGVGYRRIARGVGTPAIRGQSSGG